ncbi:hypothetical protein HGA92_02520 [Candidatus Gracilibacteria bacterium]|nr:hypothetical protein [Candidatus Gracilibacteria bacterium]NUJ99354.1 hypothetical protein [Candidatus Gracilibacteria bacterium]
MLLKNTINKFFQAKTETLLEKRLKASKIILIVFVLLFFLHYFFIGVGFYSDLLAPYLSISYSLFLLSLFLYFSLLARSFFANKLGVGAFYVVFIIFILVFLFLLLPVFIKGGIFSLLR